MAAGTELARAYVTILPDMSGVSRGIGAGLSGGAVMGEADSAGKSIGSRLMGGVTTALKGATVAVAALGIAVGGLAIKGGIARQLQIEDAESKLVSLGHTTEGVKTIMDDAMKSVKGTAYSMGDAATMAATAVAAGIKPGAELQKYLSLVGDAATVAGVSMGEMGQIFGKVQTQGRAYTMEINQLADRGIPIYQWLAEEYGVTALELRKMVSEGKVDAETYRKVIEENIGGAALQMGTTTKGAFANMGAALSRVGVQLTQWFFPLLKDVFNATTGILDGVTATLKPFSEAFTETFVAKAGPAIAAFGERAVANIGKVGAAFALFTTGDFTGDIGEALGGVEEDAPIVGTILTARDALTAFRDGLAQTDDHAANSGLALWAENFGYSIAETKASTAQFFEAFSVGLAQTDDHAANVGLSLWAENLGYSISETKAEVTGGLTAMVAAFQDGGNDNTSSGLAGMLEGIGIVARDLWDVLGPVIKELGPQIFELVTTLSPLGLIFKALQPVLPKVGDALGKVATALSGALAAVLPVVVDLVATLVDVLSGALAAVLPVIATLLATVAQVVADTLVAILPVLVPLIELVADVLVALMPPIADLVGALGGALGEVLKALMPTLVILAGVVADVLTVALDALMPIFPILVSVVMSLLKALMPLVPALLGVVNALLPLIPPLLQMSTALLPVFMGLLDALLPIIIPLVNIMVTGLVIAVDLLSVALGWVVEKITGAITWFTDLTSKGYSLRDGLSSVWEGIKSGASTAWNWIKDNVFAPFGKGIEAIGTAFDTVKGVIATAWDAISSAATGPVNFVIETVYTNGIKNLFDTVAEKLGLSLRLPTINKIGQPPASSSTGARVSGRSVAMWTGGVLPGYTPGRDVHHFTSPTGGNLHLSGGEAIMVPEWTKAVGGPAAVAAMNASARAGAGLGGDGQSFWGGGVWDWVKDKAGSAWDFTTDAVSAAANFMKDPIAGALEVISKPVMALLGGIGGGDIGQIIAGVPKAIVGSIVDSAKAIFGEPRVEDGAGDAVSSTPNVMGYQAMIAAIGQLLPGTQITSSYRPGAITAMGFPSYHGKGRAVDMAPSMAAFNAISAAYPNSTELFYSPAGARQILKRGERGNTSGVTKDMHYNHVHWSMKDGGTWPGAKVYDDGGWLPPGGVAVNLSDRPEPIFSADQWDSIDKGASNGGFEDGQVLVLEVDGERFPAMLRRVADDRIDTRQRELSGYRGRIG